MGAKSIRSYLAIFTAVFIWSSAFVAAKVAMSGLGPIMLALLRISIAFVVLLPFALKKGFKFRSLFTKTAMIYGITGYGGNLLFLNLGLASCTTNISAIIHGLFPVFMIMFGYIMLGEALNKYKAAGVAFSVIGVVIASIGDMKGDSGSTLLGMFFVALSILLWSFYSVYLKKHASEEDTFVTTQMNFGGALIVLIPLAVIEAVVCGFRAFNVEAALSLIYLGIFSGALGILLWNFGLKKVSSATAGIYFNLMPVIGVGFALAVGEAITFLQIAGCGLVLVGVLVSAKGESGGARDTSL